MKRFLVISLIFLLGKFSVLNSQEKTIEIKNEKFLNGAECKYKKVINMETNDTTYYVLLLFQNGQYRQIVDLKSIIFANLEEFNIFIDVLNAALLEIKSKSEISWNKKDYRIKLYKNELLFFETKTDGYTAFNKRGAEKLLKFLESINFGQD